MSENQELKKSMSSRDIWCLALGAMIGFGCFVLPGSTFLPSAGPLGTALGLFIGALMVMVISVSFSYLVRCIPKTGGSFLYAGALFGKTHGFILGWFLILTYFSLVPLNATALGLIGRNLFPGVLQFGYLYNIAGFDVYLGEVLVAVFFIIGVTVVNLKGGRSAGWTQTAITFGLLGSVLLIAAGVLLSKPDLSDLKPAFAEGQSAAGSIFAIVAMTPWAFVGFDCIPQAAEEFNFPPKKAMYIMLTSILVAAGLYITVTESTAVVMPWQEIVKQDWATGFAVKAVLGNFGLFFVGIAMLCAVLSGMNAFLLSASRLMYAMSRVDALPGWFGKVDRKTGVPKNTLLFLMVLSLGTPLLGRQVINWVVDMTSVGASLSFAYACAAAAKLAGKRGEKGYRFIGIAGLVLSLFFLALLLLPFMPGFLAAPSLWALIIWTVIGFVIFAVCRKKFFSSSELNRMVEETLSETELYCK